MKHKVMFILIIVLTITLVSSFFGVKHVQHVTMMIEVESREEAITWSNTYHIELLDVSTYGFATYQVPEDQAVGLLEHGFEYDQTLYPMGRITPITNDPYVSDQYALSLMKVPEAWLLADGSASVVIAIIDTGIDTDHEEFTGRILPNSYNARTKETSTTSLDHIEDDNGHGTMVAGIIAANKNNNKGIAGIVSESSLLIIKANNADNLSTPEDESKEFSDSVIAEGIHYAREQGADIINLSLGSTTQNTIVKNAVTEAQHAGIIIVGASGNDGVSTKYYPASYPGVVSVGSIDETLTISSFSNYNDAVDLTAPGAQIVSTALNNGYSIGSGTSFAAPQVTGVLALMHDYFTQLTDEQLVAQLLSTTLDRGTIGYDVYYGFGVVQAAHALDVEFVTILFETNGGTAISPIEVVKGYTFDVESPTKVGYTFIGWYLDALFTQPFQIGVDLASQSMTLYAKYEPLHYQLTLMNGDEIYSIFEVIHDLVPTLPILSDREGYTFVGWFYDQEQTIPYDQLPFSSDDILYAGYTPKLYDVTLMIGDEAYLTVTCAYHTIPVLPEPERQYPFIGWYQDALLTTPYVEEPIEEHLTLYARFDDGQYVITFYSYDHRTILSTEMLMYGDDATPPEDLIRPDSPSFSFTFVGWSENFLDITHDLSIYPIFDKTYHPESIQLRPNLDTRSSLDDWEDAGLTLIDPLLRLETDMLTIDENTYQVIYRIFDQDLLLDTRIRMVTILPKVDVTITLLPDVTTLYVGESFTDAGAITSLGQIEVIQDVNPEITGIYEVIYQVEIGDSIFQKIKYVYVLDEVSYHPTPILAYRRKEEGWVV